MDLQERYDELYEIISTLDMLINNITDRDYITELQETKYRAMNDIQEIEQRLLEQREREEQKLENEYWKEAI